MIGRTEGSHLQPQQLWASSEKPGGMWKTINAVWKLVSLCLLYWEERREWTQKNSITQLLVSNFSPTLTCTELLKVFFRELPEPVIPFFMYGPLLKVANTTKYGNCNHKFPCNSDPFREKSAKGCTSRIRGWMARPLVPIGEASPFISCHCKKLRSEWNDTFSTGIPLFVYMIWFLGSGTRSLHYTPIKWTHR